MPLHTLWLYYICIIHLFFVFTNNFGVVFSKIYTFPIILRGKNYTFPMILRAKNYTFPMIYSARLNRTGGIISSYLKAESGTISIPADFMRFKFAFKHSAVISRPTEPICPITMHLPFFKQRFMASVMRSVVTP